MIGTKIFDFWIVVYSCRIYKSKVKSLPLKYWILILMMPFLSAVIINLVFSANENDKSMMSSYMICIGGLLYLNLSVFNYFESYDKQIRLAALEKISEKENENYQAIAGSYEEIRNIKHDLKNQVSILNDLIKKKDYTSAQSHMKQLYNFVESSTSICYTGNSAVDSIINLKGDYAKSRAIRFMTKINVSQINFDTVGMCRILGNALDNAVETCERINAEEKCICIALNQLENKLIIEINNTSPAVDINDLATSKANKIIHGIGLKSIKQTVKSMNGHMSCSYENGLFTLKIMLPE
ncbi:MAG: GHKL domain-containing protein [Clostridium sp.]|nr:GHKL domain-containing protein [Clostridium sp.]